MYWSGEATREDVTDRFVRYLGSWYLKRYLIWYFLLMSDSVNLVLFSTEFSSRFTSSWYGWSSPGTHSSSAHSIHVVSSTNSTQLFFLLFSLLRYASCFCFISLCPLSLVIRLFADSFSSQASIYPLAVAVHFNSQCVRKENAVFSFHMHVFLRPLHIYRLPS